MKRNFEKGKIFFVYSCTGADAGIISTTALIFEATIKFLGVNKYGKQRPRASNKFSRMAPQGRTKEYFIGSKSKVSVLRHFNAHDVNFSFYAGVVTNQTRLQRFLSRVCGVDEDKKRWRRVWSPTENPKC